jgi:hypothetical protein
VTVHEMSFEHRLTEALAVPLSIDQRSRLDARIQSATAAWRPAAVRRWPLRRSLLVAAALLVALPAVLVAAGVFSTEDPYGLADAREFRAELEAAKVAVVLPAGRTWPGFLQVTDESAGYSRGGARSWVENVALCIWLDEWLDARAVGVTARESTAAEAIAAIPTWPSWNSPFWTQSVRDHYKPVLASVAAGDETPVRQEMATNCSWVNDGG